MQVVFWLTEEASATANAVILFVGPRNNFDMKRGTVRSVCTLILSRP
jgi:hypothetical protein